MTAELVYDHDGIALWHGDNAEVRPGPSEVDFVLTDPPYGIALDTDYSARMHLSDKSAHWSGDIKNDAKPFDPTWLMAYPRLVLWGANFYSDRLPVGSWLTWRKVGVAPVLSDCEMAWHNCGGKRVAHFESNHKATTAKEGKLHPTQKPVSLMRWIVERFTEPGDLVYDPYMGSGPVAQACADLGRRYIGVELEREYVDAAVGRLSQQTLAFG